MDDQMTQNSIDSNNFDVAKRNAMCEECARQRRFLLACTNSHIFYLILFHAVVKIQFFFSSALASF
jgi:hypothetical protein